MNNSLILQIDLREMQKKGKGVKDAKDFTDCHLTMALTQQISLTNKSLIRSCIEKKQCSKVLG